MVARNVLGVNGHGVQLNRCVAGARAVQRNLRRLDGYRLTADADLVRGPPGFPSRQAERSRYRQVTEHHAVERLPDAFQMKPATLILETQREGRPAAKAWRRLCRPSLRLADAQFYVASSPPPDRQRSTLAALPDLSRETLSRRGTTTSRGSAPRWPTTRCSPSLQCCW